MTETIQEQIVQRVNFPLGWLYDQGPPVARMGVDFGAVRDILSFRASGGSVK